jgi:peptidoglycan/xylan/chitin deacetylase (PgdA/CDA1 family)
VTADLENSRRERLARLGSRWGLIRLLEAAPRRTCLIVLGYHRVGEPTQCPYDRGVFDATPEQFDSQVGWLKQRFHVAELEEVEALLSRPNRLRHPHVLLTFDDGYLDNYQVAFPILKSHGVQAAFFLPTAFIGTDRIPWWDQIAFLVRGGGSRQIALEYPKPARYDLSELDPDEVIERLLRTFKSPDTTDPERFLAGLERACGRTLPERASPRLFMNWEEAAEMSRGGMAIGSHTHTHRLLAKLRPEEQQEELSHSKQVLRERLGITAGALAYPVGSRDSVDAATREAAERTGYRLGFSLHGGVNLPRTMEGLNLLRIPCYREISLPCFRLRTLLASMAARQVF